MRSSVSFLLSMIEAFPGYILYSLAIYWYLIKVFPGYTLYLLAIGWFSDWNVFWLYIVFTCDRLVSDWTYFLVIHCYSIYLQSVGLWFNLFPGYKLYSLVIGWSLIELISWLYIVFLAIGWSLIELISMLYIVFACNRLTSDWNVS